MSIKIEVTVRSKEALATLSAFPRLQDRAMLRGLNKAMAWARTRTVKAVTDSLNIKQKDLKGEHRFGGIEVIRASPKRLRTEMKVTGNRLPLFRFAGKPSALPQGRQKGISYKIDAGGGRKRIKGNAFLVRFKSGHHGFFRRVGSGIGPKGGVQTELAELRGPSIPHVAENQPEVKAMLDVDASERMELEVGRAMDFILNPKGLNPLTGKDEGATDGD